MKKPKTVYALFKGHVKRWTQGAFAKTKNGKNGNIVSIEDSLAGCWCLSGALTKIYGSCTEERRAALRKLQRVLPRRWVNSIVAYNDYHKRTFAQVLALVKKAGV